MQLPKGAGPSQLARRIEGRHWELQMLGFRVFITLHDGSKLNFETEADTMLGLIDAINAKYLDCEIDCIEPLDLS